MYSASRSAVDHSPRHSEVAPWLAFDAYAPFTLFRTGGGGPASSGAESIFGVGASGRYRLVTDARIEHLIYGTVRGGFTTQDGSVGPFVGMALGTAMTWLGTGRGWFAELEANHLQIGAGSEDVTRPALDRWVIGVTLGLVFRLGGETWDL